MITVYEQVNIHQDYENIIIYSLMIIYRQWSRNATYLWLFYDYPQAMIQKCSTGLVGIEDSADGSVMLRSTSLVITVAPEDTGRPATIIKNNSAELL